MYPAKEEICTSSPYGIATAISCTHDDVGESVSVDVSFVVHTHPMVVSRRADFRIDLTNAGKRVEAVVDWSGQITYFSKNNIKNAVRRDGIVEPLLGYKAAFLNDRGDIVGFGEVDILDSATTTTVKVHE